MCDGMPLTTSRAIAKRDLEDGAYYTGDHRIASIARWDAKAQQFLYMRDKFGDTFVDTCNHFEDDNGLALFVPLRKVDLKLTQEELEELQKIPY